MSTEKNRYGLSRYIEPELKRRIRKECGFGCVCCGFAIGTYEHIDPEFKDAKSHDLENIAYLCEHCHSRVTRKFWSKDKIKRARKDPWSIRHGKCHDAFDISARQLVVWLGPNRIINVPTILQIDDHPLLIIEPPEENGAPFQLSGKFYSRDEDLLFEIFKNEWIGSSKNWDIECVGGVITIRTEHRNMALRIRANPPYGIMIERANMKYKGSKLEVNSDNAVLTAPNQSAIQMQGRIITGYGGQAVLLSSSSSGGIKLGPGPFSIGGSIFSLIEEYNYPSSQRYLDQLGLHRKGGIFRDGIA